MRVAITGGTGFIGAALCRALRSDGHTVRVLSRDPGSAQRRLGPDIEVAQWSLERAEAPPEALQGVNAVVNLAGESIAGRRWNDEQMARIRSSRVDGTNALVQAMGRVTDPPRVLLSASGTGYYGPLGDEPVDESAPAGADFLSQVCQEWERAALTAEASGTRVALIRTGVALGPDGGALAKLLPPFRMFVGGPLGNGRQGFPWVHRDDVVGVYRWALGAEQAAGALNATGPEMLDNRQFSEVLGRVLGRPSWLAMPGFALKLLLGEMAEPLLLRGQKVAPTRTQALGYEFRYATAEAALRQVLG
jgi:uncharacterized protein (TIGR01777 family)